MSKIKKSIVFALFFGIIVYSGLDNRYANAYEDLTLDELEAILVELRSPEMFLKTIKNIRQEEMIKEIRKAEIRLSALTRIGMYLQDPTSVERFENEVIVHQNLTFFGMMLEFPADNDLVYESLIRCFNKLNDKNLAIEVIKYFSERKGSKMAARVFEKVSDIKEHEDR